MTISLSILRNISVLAFFVLVLAPSVHAEPTQRTQNGQNSLDQMAQQFLLAHPSMKYLGYPQWGGNDIRDPQTGKPLPGYVNPALVRGASPLGTVFPPTAASAMGWKTESRVIEGMYYSHLSGLGGFNGWENSDLKTYAQNLQAGDVLANTLLYPLNVANQAKAQTTAQFLAAGNALGELTKDQAANAIDYSSKYLQNFTADGSNVWNLIRNNLFVPIGLLLLLPGAVLSQMRAMMAAGNPVMGDCNPFDGILRSVVAIFLIPASYLVVNYGIDFSNSVVLTMSGEYERLFGSNLYRDAMCAQIRAFPVRGPEENRNVGVAQPWTQPAVVDQKSFEAGLIESKIDDPCGGASGASVQNDNRTDEGMPGNAVAARFLAFGANAGLTLTWDVLCAFQMAYLLYLFFVGPVVAGLWAWPMVQLRNAFPSWVEGVITVCFWSLFWNTVILLMACFKGVGETGTLMIAALNFLAVNAVKFAFDFSGLVRAAGAEAAKNATSGAQGAAGAPGLGGAAGGVGLGGLSAAGAAGTLGAGVLGAGSLGGLGGLGAAGAAGSLGAAGLGGAWAAGGVGPPIGAVVAGAPGLINAPSYRGLGVTSVLGPYLPGSTSGPSAPSAVVLQPVQTVGLIAPPPVPQLPRQSASSMPVSAPPPYTFQSANSSGRSTGQFAKLPLSTVEPQFVSALDYPTEAIFPVSATVDLVSPNGLPALVVSTSAGSYYLVPGFDGASPVLYAPTGSLDPAYHALLTTTDATTIGGIQYTPISIPPGQTMLVSMVDGRTLSINGAAADWSFSVTTPNGATQMVTLAPAHTGGYNLSYCDDGVLTGTFQVAQSPGGTTYSAFNSDGGLVQQSSFNDGRLALTYQYCKPSFAGPFTVHNQGALSYPSGSAAMLMQDSVSNTAWHKEAAPDLLPIAGAECPNNIGVELVYDRDSLQFSGQTISALPLELADGSSGATYINEHHSREAVDASRIYEDSAYFGDFEIAEAARLEPANQPVASNGHTVVTFLSKLQAATDPKLHAATEPKLHAATEPKLHALDFLDLDECSAPSNYGSPYTSSPSAAVHEVGSRLSSALKGASTYRPGR